MTKVLSVLFILLIFLQGKGLAQLTPAEKHLIDSLTIVVKSSKSHDTSFARALVKLSNVLYISNFDTIMPLCLKSKEIVEKGLKGNPGKLVRRSFLQSYAEATNNLGYFSTNTGNITSALDYFRTSLKSYETLGEQHGIATVYNNMAELYNAQQDFEKATEYLKKSLRIRRKLGKQEDIANSLNNLGELYSSMNQNELAKKHHLESLAIRMSTNDQMGISSSLHNLGVVYMVANNNQQALANFSKSLEISKAYGDLEGICFSLLCIGKVQFVTRDYEKAEKNVLASLKIARQIGFPDVISNCCELLSRIYQKQGKYEMAVSMLRQHLVMKDSILNDINKKATMKLGFQFEFEKKAVADSLKTAKEKEITNIQLREEKNARYFLFGVLLIILVFSGFIFNRYRVTRRQKEIITIKEQETHEQKCLLEEKNQEITDSINYAKRIQSAILPQDKLIKEHLPNSFVLYKPKDIVAGDFYWFDIAQDLILIAAADCTGHGVPGALVSVVCHNALNRSLKEFSLTNPAEILDKTREIVVAEFEKSEEDVKDGMDISLCVLNQKNLTLSWAGAHNPLWILRNQEIIEYKADKQPIGKFAYAKAFTNHEITLQKEDEIFIFTDGFQDQFGGEKGKKFKASQMKEILLASADKSIFAKEKTLHLAFDTWRKDFEQVDDVCVIGISL